MDGTTYSEDPPSFGHPMLKCFGFEESYINLNHGSYGSLPLPVLAACDKLTRDIESNPDKFLRTKYGPLLTTVRERLAHLIGAQTDECVMVPNATHGVNTVLRNFEWQQGDIIVGATTTYGAVSRTIQYIADQPPRPEITTFHMTFPTSHTGILKSFREHLHGLPRQRGQKIVAVIDSLVSNPGVQLPWEEMVKICKEEGVWSVIDAAHAIGQQVGLNLNKTDPDFWISNCHKWLYAKRGCAVLYTPKRNQHMLKTTLPTSFDYVSPTDPPGGPEAPNFVLQFGWTGTIDAVPYLSVSHALDFRKWLGGEERINKYCHGLALEGGKRLAEVLGTHVMDPAGDLTANMVNVALPLQGVPARGEINKRVQMALLDDWNVFVAPFYHDGKWWARCSAQIWNELSDFEYVGKAFNTICKDIRDEFAEK